MTAPLTDPERALIGAVLHLPASSAVAVLDLVDVDDLAQPRLRVTAGLARQLAEDGTAPDPVAVLAHARATGTVIRAEAIGALSLLLAELYGDCPTPASAGYYAAAVLDEAVRRRCTELSVRIGQAADGESLESLLALVDVEARAVREVADRRAAAAGQARPRLAAVPGVSA